MIDFAFVFITVVAWCGVFVSVMVILDWIDTKFQLNMDGALIRWWNTRSKNRKPTKCKQFGCDGRSTCVVDSTYECKLYIKKPIPIPKPNTKKYNVGVIIHTTILGVMYLWVGYLFGSLLNIIMYTHVLIGFVSVLVVSVLIVLVIDAMKWFTKV